MTTSSCSDPWWLITASERLEKQGLVMENLSRGMGGLGRRWTNRPPGPLTRFICCGQLWVVEDIVPQAVREGIPFWMIDNGYYKQSGKGRHMTGHWECTYRGAVPVLMERPDWSRHPAEQVLAPWRPLRPGDGVLVAQPGPTFGRVLGMDMKAWMRDIVARVRQHTRRPVRVRSKTSQTPLVDDLRGIGLVVTHSSHVAIDAIVRGIPCIVADTSPAAPVCSTRLEDIETPWMPDRRHWWASLMSQQYTLKELSSGVAWRLMERVMEQVDG